MVVEASSESEAARVAADCARARETTFTSMDGTLVAWKFHSVTQVSLRELPLTSGYEISSRHLRNDEAVSLMEPIDDAL